MTPAQRPPLPGSFFVAVIAGTVGAILWAGAFAIGTGIVEAPTPMLEEPGALGAMVVLGGALIAFEVRAVLGLARARRAPPDA